MRNMGVSRLFIGIVIAAIIVIALFVTVLLQRPEEPTGATIVYNPYGEEGSWHKGQLHCHSTQSDGRLAPPEVISRYADLGFEFVALTDHNQVTLTDGPILVLGEEYGQGSTESGVGTHMNGINISTAPGALWSAQDRVDAINAQGGIASLNHPDTWPFRYSDDVLAALVDYTSLEIVNGDVDPGAFEIWDDALRSGKRVWGVATDDAHTADQYGHSWIAVRMPGAVTTDNVLEAIRKGSLYASQGPLIEDIRVSERYLNVSCSGADQIRFYGPEQKLLASVDGEIGSYALRGSEGFVRAEVDVGELSAWTQPVFVESMPQPSPSSDLGDMTSLSLAPPSVRTARD
jgi:hypothetical protein